MLADQEGLHDGHAEGGDQREPPDLGERAHDADDQQDQQDVVDLPVVESSWCAASDMGCLGLSYLAM